MSKRECFYCYPKREFGSWKELNYHIEMAHSGQVYLDKTYYNPLFNTIFITLLFIIVEIISNFRPLNPIISVMLILESGIFPVLYIIGDHKKFRERYSCPICASLVFPRIDRNRFEYWVCANDSCEMHGVKMNFLTWQYEEKL